MKNLNLLWNSLLNTLNQNKDQESVRNRHKPQFRESSLEETKESAILKRSNSTSIVRRMISGRSGRSSRSPSTLYSSCSSSSAVSGGTLSMIGSSTRDDFSANYCTTYLPTTTTISTVESLSLSSSDNFCSLPDLSSVTNNDQLRQSPEQQQQQQGEDEEDVVVNNNRKSPLPRISYPSPSSTSRYQHPESCRCSVCLLHRQLLFYEQKLINWEFGCIAEEDNEEEEEENDIEPVPEQPKPQMIKMDRIEPFQKPEALNSFWKQAPAEFLRAHSYDDENNDNSNSNVTTKTAINSSVIQSQSHLPSIDQSSSNFLRTNQMRSSCPPQTRRRRRKNSVAGSGSTHTTVLPPSIPTLPSIRNSHSNIGDSVKPNWVHNKLSSVRKSWLFNLFQPNNSKEKESKWAKSDDFEAEFFDRHRQLTESLISRRSPIESCLVSKSGHQMSTSMSLIEQRRQQQQQNQRQPQSQQLSSSSSVSKCNTTTTTAANAASSLSLGGSSRQLVTTATAVTNATVQCNVRGCSPHPKNNNQNNKQDQLRPPPPTQQPAASVAISQSRSIYQSPASITASTDHLSIGSTTRGAVQRRPRPRSACLDTYMLRIRNGDYIEFSVDNDNKDETCSIVSSTNYLTSDPLSISGQSGQIATTGSYPNTPKNSHHSRSASSQLPSSSSSITHTSSLTHSNLANSSSAASNLAMINSLTSQQSCRATPLTNTSSSLSSASNSSSGANPNFELNSLNPIMISPSTISANSDPTAAPIYIYWPVKKFTELSVGLNDTAFDVINKFVASHLYGPAYSARIQQQGNNNNKNINPTQSNLSPNGSNCPYIYSYALRLICRNLNQNDHFWLHPGQNIQDFIDQNVQLLENGWKFEMRIRYIPFNLEELNKTDFVTFKFFYEQVLDDYLRLELSTKKLGPNQDLIVELGCLELRRKRPNLTPQGLEKKSSFEEFENELNHYFPTQFITNVKPKLLRKLVRNQFKVTHSLRPEEAMLHFLNQVSQFINFRREFFHCCLGESAWGVSVDFVIGSDIGIAYFTSNSTPPTVITKSFDSIELINIVSHTTMSRTNGESKSESGSSDPEMSTIGKKILLNIQIKNVEDILVLSCTSFSIAQSIADLIDGYHRLATNSVESIWKNNSDKNIALKNGTLNRSKTNSIDNSIKMKPWSEVIEPKRAQFELISNNTTNSNSTTASSAFSDKLNKSNDSDINNYKNKIEDCYIEDGDYSNPTEYCCTEISRENLRIDELIGKGQFGDVHRGVYYPPSPSSTSLKSDNSANSGKEIQVAIKISSVQNLFNRSSSFGANDIFSDDRKLLCEAERMHQLDHAHIIKLIGVCSGSPVYVIMELAQYGELRDFLQNHGSSLEHRVLIDYSYQIASALSYLESRQFVHRDIAARNVLVFSFDCIKLADFGLSRYIEDASYYMATNSKLPIKWMAPESINFRRFTTSSDVWMFAVCMWEIFMLGKKPFQGVKNNEVIGLIESGERLSKPIRCPSSLYDMMVKCWRYEPERRPTFKYIKRTIEDVYQNELGLVGAIARIDMKDLHSSPESSIFSSSTSFNNENAASASSSLSRHERLNEDSPKTNYLTYNKSQLSLNTSQSSMDSNKIDAILAQQRKRVEEDSLWIKKNEKGWQKSRFDSLSRSSDNSSAASIYEDADSGKNGDLPVARPDHLYSVPNLPPAKCRSECQGEEESQYNSFKSTTSSFVGNLSKSSIDSNESSTSCGLSVSLKKFFKHNQLTNSNVRQEMMKKLNYSSAKIDRDKDYVYSNTISVVNSVRHLLKGVEEINTSEYIDLVKNVGQELRNLLVSLDQILETFEEETHHSVAIAQKKLSADMNDLVESMKKTITYSETPMEGVYKQNMLESAYVLVIDSKNLLDTLDEARISQAKLLNNGDGEHPHQNGNGENMKENEVDDEEDDDDDAHNEADDNDDECSTPVAETPSKKTEKIYANE